MNAPPSSRALRPLRLTDGEIGAELRDPATTGERRGELEAEMADRRVCRAALGREAREAARKAGERARVRLGPPGGQR